MVTVLDAPAGMRWHAYDLGAIDTVAEQRSVYTGAAKRLDFGGNLWTLKLATRDQTQAHAAALEAWCDALRAADAVARLGPPPGYAAQGTTTAETLTLAAARAAGASLLAVNGLGAGLTIAAGSYVSIADHLHRVRATVAGGSGDQLQIWPPLREAAAMGAVVEIGAGVRSLWRLQGRPTRSAISDRPALAAPVELQFMEAI
ncbi:MAG: hypothetical protein ACJA1L_002950 [Paracoccaceae bacterium]|jgi:hypothetical protein